MFESIGLKRKEGITIVTIMEKDTERWDEKLVKELTDFIKSLQEETDTKVLLFVREKFQVKPNKTRNNRLTLQLAGEEERKLLFDQILQLKIATIAVMTGVVSGDYFELSLQCDLRLASEHTQLGGFCENESLLHGTGAKKISQLIGEMKTKELFFTGKIISAEQGNQIGFINKVAEEERLMAESIETAKLIKTTPEKTVRSIKELFQKANKR